MSVIFSNVPPLVKPDGEYTLPQCLKEKVDSSEELVIAVGYASKNSLSVINTIIAESKLKRVTLVLGMYYVEGFPEGTYNVATKIDEIWRQRGVGEIRLTKSMKYHGKVYAFYNGKVSSVIVGSHNLDAIQPTATNLRQYELSLCTEDPDECAKIDAHLKSVIAYPISEPISCINGINLIHDHNTKLDNVEGVTKVSMEEVEAYKKTQTEVSFEIPLKVPGIPDDSKDYMKSNINKCYAKGRLTRKTGVVSERGWWETEVIVSKKITKQETWPEYRVPFFIITDDGWKFKVHASGTGSKNLESHGDLKILGYWLKGRLVAAGIIEPVDSPEEDLLNNGGVGENKFENCKGVITYKKLCKYGRTSMTLTKTKNKLADESGVLRDVWTLSFLPKNVK